MRKGLALFSALAYLCAAQAAWAGGFGGLLNSFWSGKLTFLQCSNDTSNTNVYTFSSTNVGGAASNRKTIVGIFGYDSPDGDFSVSTVTIGGDSATEVVDSADINSRVQAAIYIMDNTAGTSEDIVVTFSESILSASICVWQANGLSSSTATDSTSAFDTNSDPALTLDNDANAGGVTVGMCGTESDGNRTAWTGLTEQNDTDVGTGEGAKSAADLESGSTGTVSITCDYDGSGDSIGAVASFPG